MRIAIANDGLVAAEALRRVVATVPDYELAWIAYDGMEAVVKCAIDPPDLILMDLVMPTLDGVEATRRIMAQSPCAVLMVTAGVHRLRSEIFAAMGYGALDVVHTPILGSDRESEGSLRLLAKIATIRKLLGKSRCKVTQSPPPPVPLSRGSRSSSLVVIGASTGGPQAIATILAALPTHFPAAIVIVQHIDAQFAPGLADWLNQQSRLPVQLVTPGYPPQPGRVWLAGTDQHLMMRSQQLLSYTPPPQHSIYHPSIDVFFQSVAQHWIGQGIGVLLTGMGKDGAVGLGALRSAGWLTIAQDQRSSVVYGMPKVAAELGSASQVLPIQNIGAVLTQRLSLS
ncbi:chemotaxis response regulator protein-glutamate methylesterase [Pantanalinema rosaneae CENA516]|uniref:chemotaxis response regulator protein-glutamate methylesterase n=1 Tax=Pantanalinema rosaneae TaxID=1620701 RepID=UPI003D6E4DF7